MKFDKSNQAIYLQIVDYVCEQLLLEEWKPDEKIPSVREMGATMGVNPNTVSRAYDILKQEEMIYDKRGIGSFIAAKGTERAREYQKRQFTEHELPQIFKTMYLLGLEPEDLKSRYQDFKRKYKNN